MSTPTNRRAELDIPKVKNEQENKFNISKLKYELHLSKDQRRTRRLPRIGEHLDDSKVKNEPVHLLEDRR